MFNINAAFQLLFFFLKLASCDIQVYNLETHEMEMEFKDVPSKFGDPIPEEGITGLVVYSKPPEACGPIEKPPYFHNYTGKWIVLIKRYKCQFEDKVRNAQKAGYDAVIVHNVESSVLKPMAADNPNGIHIPSVFIGSESGHFIQNNYLYNDGYFIVITDDIPFNFTSRLLIIFSILIGFCFFAMIFYLIVKYFKDRKRRQRNCLSKSSLEKITLHKFKKNDPYEICAICLEEYVENDKLRVLPCSHAYHSKCIDPWLTKSKRVCPVCKRKVFANGEIVTDSDPETDDERTPLIGNENQTNAGTFTRPINNPTRRWLFSDSTSGSSFTFSTSSGNSTETYNSVPETVRQSQPRDVVQTYSINLGEQAEARPPRRSNRQRPSQLSGPDVERC